MHSCAGKRGLSMQSNAVNRSTPIREQDVDKQVNLITPIAEQLIYQNQWRAAESLYSITTQQLSNAPISGLNTLSNRISQQLNETRISTVTD